MWVSVLLLLIGYGTYYVMKPYIYYLRIKNPRCGVFFYPISSFLAQDQKDFLKAGDSKYTYKKMIKENPQLEVIVSSFLGKKVLILISPDLRKEALIDQNLFLRKPSPGLFNPYLIDQGLLITDVWKDQRKLISEYFTFQRLQTQLPLIQKIGLETLALLNNPDYIKTHGLYRYAEKFTGSIVVQSFFGDEFKDLKIDGMDIASYVTLLFGDLSQQTFKSSSLLKKWILGQHRYKFLNAYEKQLEIRVNKLRNTILENIKKREQKLGSQDTKQLGMNDFVGFYLVNRKATSNFEEVVQQFISFLLAGTDTTAHLIVICLYLLGEYPHYQEKLFKELDSYSNDKSPTLEDFKNMPFLSAFINESLRFKTPVVRTFIRQATKSLKVGPYQMNKDDMLIVEFATSQLNEQYFDRADEFLPERWLEKDVLSSVNPFAYTPFSAGPRNCIGQHLAMIETKVALFQHVKSYHITRTAQPPKFKFRFLYELEDDQNIISLKRR